LVLHLSGVMLGLVGGRLLGLTWGDRIAVSFAGSQKTLPVALFVFGAYYREEYPLAVLPLLLYHAGQLLIDTFLAERMAVGGEIR
jgi:sodium/bile acid cotransporter 7